MIKSYEAYYEHGQLRWIGDKPGEKKARVIVTLLPVQEARPFPKNRCPAPSIAQKGKILGDIINPAAGEEDWEVLK